MAHSSRLLLESGGVEPTLWIGCPAISQVVVGVGSAAKADIPVLTLLSAVTFDWIMEKELLTVLLQNLFQTFFVNIPADQVSHESARNNPAIAFDVDVCLTEVDPVGDAHAK